MSPDGLWTVNFAGSQQQTANEVVSERINRGGILVLTDGHIYGGSISYYFVGTYKTQDRNISLAITAARYNDLAPGPFGNLPEARLIFSGKVLDNAMSLEGHLEGDTSKRLIITAQRRHTLNS
jgi:hypothetical protein